MQRENGLLKKAILLVFGAFEHFLGVLIGVEAIVMPALVDQLAMRADFDDFALFKDEDAVRADDCGQSVRDDERGPAFQKLVDRELDRAFGFGVDRGGRFVQD